MITPSSLQQALALKALRQDTVRELISELREVQDELVCLDLFIKNIYDDRQLKLEV